MGISTLLALGVAQTCGREIYNGKGTPERNPSIGLPSIVAVSVAVIDSVASQMVGRQIESAELLVDSLSRAPTSSCDHGNDNGNGNDFLG